jgi:hypothetical protein
MNSCLVCELSQTISAQNLSYVFLMAVLAKKFTILIPGWWERNANQALSVTTTKAFIHCLDALSYST